MKNIDREFSLEDLFRILSRRKRGVLCIFILCVVGASLYAFLTPTIYKAESIIFSDSSQSKGSMTSFMQLGVFAGGFGGGSFAPDIFVSVLSSNAVVDKMIDKFDLMSLYDQNVRLKMRKKVRRDVLKVAKDKKSGIVTIAIFDKDPARAAEMANAFVDELKNKLQSFSFGEASQRRIFFEKQIRQAFDALSIAEDEMLKYQESKGVVAIEPQLEALLKSITALRSQIAEQEVQIAALKTYAKKENPALKLAESQLIAMKTELARLEEQHGRAGKGERSGFRALSSIQQAPSLGMEYQRRLRDVKFAAAMYELMLKQLETAKLDEAKDSLVVQVIDPATPPDYRDKPNRLLIIILGVLAGLFLGAAWAFGGSYIDAAKIIKQS